MKNMAGRLNWNSETAGEAEALPNLPTRDEVAAAQAFFKQQQPEMEM